MKPCQSFQCPVEATLQLIGGKYKSLILWHLIGIPVLEAMCNWGNSYLEGTATCVNSCSSI